MLRDSGLLRLSSRMLDDPKFGTLNDKLYRRYVEVALLASRCDPMGYLPDLQTAAWYIHQEPDALLQDLIELWKAGIIKRPQGEGWYVPGVEPAPMTRREIMRYEFVRQRRERFRQLVERDGEYCQYCGTTQNLSIDHVMAIANGGTNDLDNLQLLCRSCNSRKGAR